MIDENDDSYDSDQFGEFHSQLGMGQYQPFQNCMDEHPNGSTGNPSSWGCEPPGTQGPWPRQVGVTIRPALEASPNNTRQGRSRAGYVRDGGWGSGGWGSGESLGLTCG